MKILIDENLPLKLAQSFGNLHEVRSAREMNWHGKKNGELLGLMTLAGFEGFVTMDKNLPEQQNLKKFAIRIFVLRGVNNKLATLQELIPLLLAKIDQRLDVSVIEIRK
ncbi:MAG: hypothetical protein M3Q26_11190 [Acidobacteriota bacterium]|nr:hypothetical protein [Acidobacteriota bacterium]